MQSKDLRWSDGWGSARSAGQMVRKELGPEGSPWLTVLSWSFPFWLVLALQKRSLSETSPKSLCSVLLKTLLSPGSFFTDHFTSSCDSCKETPLPLSSLRHLLGAVVSTYRNTRPRGVRGTLGVWSTVSIWSWVWVFNRGAWLRTSPLSQTRTLTLTLVLPLWRPGFCFLLCVVLCVWPGLGGGGFPLIFWDLLWSFTVVKSLRPGFLGAWSWISSTPRPRGCLSCQGRCGPSCSLVLGWGPALNSKHRVILWSPVSDT